MNETIHLPLLKGFHRLKKVNGGGVVTTFIFVVFLITKLNQWASDLSLWIPCTLLYLYIGKGNFPHSFLGCVLSSFVFF